jgi:hypothetical protein
VGFARAFYPDDLKEPLMDYQQNSEDPIRDYVFAISDGTRYHYISVSASDFLTPVQQLRMLLNLSWLFDVDFLDDL